MRIPAISIHFQHCVRVMLIRTKVKPVKPCSRTVQLHTMCSIDIWTMLVTGYLMSFLNVPLKCMQVKSKCMFNRVYVQLFLIQLFHQYIYIYIYISLSLLFDLLLLFFPQFCDDVEVVIIHKMI